MKYEKIFEEIHYLLESCGDSLQLLETNLIEDEGTYLGSCAYSLNMAHRWLKDLKENFLERNPELAQEEIKVKEVTEEKIEEEIYIEDILEEAEETSIIDELKEFKRKLNNISHEYNKVLLLLLDSEVYVHSFLTNVVNQHLREAYFTIEFEINRIEELNENL